MIFLEIGTIKKMWVINSDNIIFILQCNLFFHFYNYIDLKYWDEKKIWNNSLKFL